MRFYHSIPVQIRFHDIDMAGHVNNAVYQEYFDLGRVNYFREIMKDSLDFMGLSMVIASFKVDFFLPVFLEDQIIVETKVIALGNKSLEMAQQVIRAGESEPRAFATTIMVCFDYSKQLSEIVPEKWKSEIIRLEQGDLPGKISCKGSDV